MPDIFDKVSTEKSGDIFDQLEKAGPIISTRTEEPGFFSRIFRPGAPSPTEKAKASNIVALSESTGLSPSIVEKNYDAITKELGIRGVPTTGEMVQEGMKWMIGGGLAQAPIRTISGLAGYMGAKEAESALTSTLKRQPYRFGAGRELSEFAGEVGPATKTALEAVEFAGPAVPLGIAGKGLKGYLTRGLPKDVLKPIQEIRTKAQVPYPLSKGPGVEDLIPPELKRPALTPAIDFEIVKPRPETILREAPPPEEPSFTAGVPSRPNVVLPEVRPKELVGTGLSREESQRALSGLANYPKRPYTPGPKVIGEETGKADRVAEAWKKGFQRSASDQIVLREPEIARQIARMREEEPTVTPEIVIPNEIISRTTENPNPEKLRGLVENLFPEVTEKPPPPAAPTPMAATPSAIVPPERLPGEGQVEKPALGIFPESERATLEKGNVQAQILDREMERFGKSRAMGQESFFEEPTGKPTLFEGKKIAAPITVKSGTFLSWIKGKGGFWDETLPGETKYYSAKESGVVGLTSKERGRTFDELIQQAVEEGWLSKGSTVNDLIRATDREIMSAKHGGSRLFRAGQESAAMDKLLEQKGSTPLKDFTPQERTRLQNDLLKIGDMGKEAATYIKGLPENELRDLAAANRLPFAKDRKKLEDTVTHYAQRAAQNVRHRVGEEGTIPKAGDFVEFTDDSGKLQKGKIRDYDPWGKKALIFPEDRSLIKDKDMASIEVPVDRIGLSNPSVSQKISSAIEKDPKDRNFSERNTVRSTLVNKLKDETGAIFIPGRRGRITPPPTTLPPTADNVKLMYEITDDALRDLHRISFKQVKDFLVRGMIDASGNVKRSLVEKGGWLGQQVVEKKDLIAGAPSRAAQIIEGAEKQIYGDLSKKEIHILDRMINSGRTVVIDQYKVTGPGGPLATPQAYMKHPMGQTGAAHEGYLNDLARIEGISTQKIAVLKQRQKDYYQLMRDQLDDKLNAGLISPELHQKLYPLDYSLREFIQHIDPIQTVNMGGKLITVPSSGIKALEEGSYNLLNYDSRHLLAEVVARNQATISRNNANVALLDLAVNNPGNGIVEMAPKEGVPTGYAPIKAMVKGQPQEMMMPLELAQEWVVTDPLINSTFANVLSWVSGAKILRAAATGYNPAFAISNMPRDMGLVWMANKEYSPHMPVALAQFAGDYATVWKDAIGRKGRWKDYVNEGGGMELLTHYGRFKGSGEINKVSKVLGYIGETSEILTRLALRERAIKNGKSPEEATWIARSYLDFYQGGGTIKAIDKVVPYFNPAVQGTRSIVRAAKNDPKIFAYKAAQLVALSGSLYIANRIVNDEGYRQVSDREKEANYIFMMPSSFAYTDDKGDKRHMYLKIAKDQGQRIFTMIPEAISDRFFNGKLPTDHLYQAIGDFVNITPTQLIAPLQTSIFSYVMDKNFWTNKDLWQGPKGIEPSEEYRAGDYPDFYLKLAEISRVSPARFAGAVGRILPYSNPFIGLLGGGFDLVTGKMSDDLKGKVTKQILSENPSIRRLMSSTSPYVEGKAEREDIRKEEATKQWKQNRMVDDLTNKYLKENKPETYQKLESFIGSQSEEDQDRLLKRVETAKTFYGGPDHTWWVSLKNTNDPETRARLFMEKYRRASTDKRQEMIDRADQVTGIVTDRFLAEIEKSNKPLEGRQ